MISITQTFVTQTCINCGVAFAVTSNFNTERLRDGAYFYCPNGHSQFYRETTAARLQREKDALERSLQAKLNEANHAKLVAEKERDSAIRAKRKVERRVAHGVCPCCNKTFGNVADHMMTDHPEYRLPEGKRQKQIAGAA